MKLKTIFTLLSLLLVSLYPALSEAAVDVSTVTSKLDGDGQTAISAIGTSILGLAAVAVIFKWSKGSVFG